MKHKSVAHIGKPVSELVLGSAWFTLDEREQWFRLMDAFIDHGGTAIDTARCYGQSEDVIGQWLTTRGNREQMVIITKGGLSRADSAKLANEDFEDTLEDDLTQSLEHLGTDHIDLYLLHRDEPSLPVGRVMECLDSQRSRGRIRAFGGSNWEPSRFDEANEYADQHGLTRFAAISNNVSLAAPAAPFYPGLVSVNKETWGWYADSGTPDFSWSSQARGFFTGKFRPETWEDTVRAGETSEGFARRMLEAYGTADNFERLRRAQELGRRKGGYSAVQVAMAWLVRQPLNVFPVIGPRTIEELTSCVESLEVELTDGEARWLNLEGKAIDQVNLGDEDRC